MVAKINKVVSLLLLVIFLPVTNGFALIHHYCGGGENLKTHTHISILPHNHEEEPCMCDNDPADLCSNEVNGSCACSDNSDEDRSHNCQAEFIKLDLQVVKKPSSRTEEKTLLTIHFLNPDFSTTGKTLAINCVKNIVVCYEPVTPKYNYQIHILNCVFRL